MSRAPAVVPRVVVLGCGNPSRGDDALGPGLMTRVEAWITLHPDRPLTAVEDFQFQVEHTLDLQGQDLALFVDATASGPEPMALRRIAPHADYSFSTHALSPEALLQAFVTLDRGTPPSAFSLAVRGYSFGLGSSLSEQAAVNLDRAWRLLEQMLESPSAANWEELCTYEPGHPHSAPPAEEPAAPSSISPACATLN